MPGLPELKLRFRMPDEEPNVPENMHGWFGDEHKRVLMKFLPQATLIAEAGSWLGKSATFMLENSTADIICIDTWLGNYDHYLVPAWAQLLPTLCRTFMKNMWKYRDRVIPMRVCSDVGFEILNKLQVQPDLIYIDAAHDYLGVLRDLIMCCTYFPNAQLVGDDITWDTVKPAVYEVAQKFNKKVVVDGNCWYYENDKKMEEYLSQPLVSIGFKEEG